MVGQRLTRRRFLGRMASLTTGAVLAGCRSLAGPPPLPAGTPTHQGESTLPPMARGGKPALAEARHYHQLDGNQVRCKICFRECLIAEGGRGFCRVRENRGGELYLLVYGRPATLQVDPIELEPMYHLLPGHSNLCVATASCNFRCKHCHNWHLTQRGPEEVEALAFSAAEVVEETIRRGCRSISHSINEPTIFYEYMYDIARLARQRGLRTLFHTNGSLRPEPLRALLEHMDGVTVDLKSFSPEFYRENPEAELTPVLQTLKLIRQEGVHLEIVNLVIPTLNDDLRQIEKMCGWIEKHLGKDVPLHFTRFFPRYKLTHLPPTPVKTLERARDIALEVGLHYVYIGNLPGHEGNSTYCPRCGRRVISRRHFTVLSKELEGGRCSFCGQVIVGIWA